MSFGRRWSFSLISISVLFSQYSIAAVSPTDKAVPSLVVERTILVENGIAKCQVDPSMQSRFVPKELRSAGVVAASNSEPLEIPYCDSEVDFEKISLVADQVSNQTAALLPGMAVATVACALAGAALMAQEIAVDPSKLSKLDRALIGATFGALGAGSFSLLAAATGGTIAIGCAVSSAAGAYVLWHMKGYPGTFLNPH